MTMAQTGKNFVTADVPANTLTTLIPPATNTNGITLQTLSLAMNPTNAIAYVYANETPPAQLIDPNARAIFIVTSTSGVGSANMSAPIFLRAGLGLYLIANSICFPAISYDVVS